MNPPPVTIVVPVYQHLATVSACLRAVLEHTDYPDWEVIVVDDGAGPELASLLPKASNVRLLRQEHGGAARALNAGFAAAAGRDVVRLHADVVIETPGWLRLLAAAASAQPRIAAVGVRLLYPDGRIQSEGRSIVSGFGFHLRHVDRKAYQPESAAGKLTEVDTVPGALAYYRRSAVDEIGGLDEGYGPAWFEDDDFCFAARRLNYKVWVEPAVRAVHYTRSCPPTFPQIKGQAEKVLGPLVKNFKQTGWRMQADRWQAKWGWHPYFPDLNEIRRLYGDTEVCWQIGEPLRFQPTSPTPVVDCCIVTWNSLGYLKRTLESLAAVDYPPECVRVFVTNNGGTDGTAQYLEELAATYPFALTAINLPLNTGVAVGLNFALQAGDGELVARLDDDILLPRDWLRVMLQDLVQRPFAGCVGLKTLGDDDRRAIQWAGEQKHPRIFSHADEPDAGQADVLWRVPHVAGCCVLYRRDAIRRCGPIDVRYSPTQTDDIDHSTALVHAGFEVLCEGRTHVLHKRTSGLDRSAAGMTSAAANGRKLYGKWGDDAFAQLDNTLILSREGRCLPPDGDTSAWMARGPNPAEFPRTNAALDAATDQFIRRLYEAQGAPVPVGSELHAVADHYLAGAQTLQQDGDLREAADAVLMVVNFAPLRLEAYRALSVCYRDLGQSTHARNAARRGLHLFPNDVVLRELAAVTPERIAQREKTLVAAAQAEGNRSVPEAPAGWSVSGAPRVLLVKSFQTRRAEDLSYVDEYCQRLIAAGVPAAIRAVPQPDPRGFDIVHLWGSAQPHQTLAQLKAVRVLAPDVPVVLTPLYGDAAGAKWSGQVVSSVCNRSGRAQWELGLNEFAAGKLVLSTETRPERSRFALQSQEMGVLQRQLFEQVDQVLPLTDDERAEIRKYFGIELDGMELPVGADRAELAAAPPERFVREHRLSDFVLMTGPVEPSRNQLIALFALQAANLPTVVAGPHTDPAYVAMCRKVAPRGTLFLDSLARPMLYSAYRAARVFVAPGWHEPACTGAVEAAFAGCSLALSNRLSERAEFEGSAQFFAPERYAAVRVAVQAAWTAHAASAPARAALAARLAPRHDWSAVTAKAVAAYESVLARA